MNKISERLIVTLSALIYSGILVLIHKYELSTYWHYAGFNWEPSTSKLFLTIILIAAVAFFLPTSISTRNIFLQLCLYFHFIPSLLLYALQDQKFGYLAALLTGTFLLILFSFASMRRLKSPELNWAQVFFIAFFTCLAVLVGLIAFSGIGNFTLSFSEVYTYRALNKENLPGIFGYLRPVATKVMLPMALILALRLRNRILVVLMIMVSVAFFAYSFHKSILFASMAALAIYYTLERVRSSKIIGFLSIGLLLVIISSILWATYFEQQNSPSYIASLLARRAIFVPVLLDMFYVDFFSENSLFFWSQSSLGFGLAERPFELNAPYLIGMEFFGNEAMSANAGYIGAGFSNAGITGVAIYGIIIGLIVAFLNEYGKKVGHPFTVAVGFSLFMAVLRSTDLSTAFLTHGLMFLLIFFVFLPTHKSLRPMKSERDGI